MNDFRFCFTLDTEPDDLWACNNKCSFDSFTRLPAFHRKLVQAGARPTYLTTSEVVESEDSKRAMSEILDFGFCEIGAHFHTWTRTWPFDTPDLRTKGETKLLAMAHQLGQEIEEKMLAYTCESLKTNLGVIPRSYRGGRWSFGPMTPLSLIRCGIRVDSTITPGLNWQDKQHAWLDGPDFRDNDPMPTKLMIPEDKRLGQTNGSWVMELPVGGCFLPPWIGSLLKKRFFRKVAAFIRRITGYPAGHCWLRPTSTPLSHMQILLRHLKRTHVPVWVIMIHSTEIAPCTKFATEEQCRDFIARCIQVVQAAVDLGAKPATLEEAAQWVEVNRFVS